MAFWQPWDRGTPHLYQVRVALTEYDDTELCSHETPFGFRGVSVDPQAGLAWTVNLQRYFPRGTNYIASQWLSETLAVEGGPNLSHPFPPPATGLPETQPHWFERDVALIRRANLNLVRVHAQVLPPEFYEACDRAGLLVWQDFPLQWGYGDSPEFQAEAERQLAAMVRTLYNHPSIVAWCCHNESPREGDAASPNRDLDQRLQATAQALDPTRYVHMNSGSGDAHAYPGWYTGHWRDYAPAAGAAGQPVQPAGAPFPSEYGAQALPNAESLRHIFSGGLASGRALGADAGYGALAQFKAWLESQPGDDPLGRLPPLENTPGELHAAREAWAAWCFHNFQPRETFAPGRVDLGCSLEGFAASSQAYQSRILQFATETYRQYRYAPINGVIQFMFADPWPAITWSVLDYWRQPKPGYEVLRRAMQPVLPAAGLAVWNGISPGQEVEIPLFVINDLAATFFSASCEWELESGGELLATGLEAIDLPADSRVTCQPITATVDEPGVYRLTLLARASDERVLGENRYEFRVE